MLGVRAIMLVLIPLVAALAGCEYPDDREATGVPVSPPPSDPSPQNRVTPHSQQAYIDALSELLGPPGDDGLPYAAGNAASWAADISAGEYFLTAACVAAPGAELTVQSGSAEPERTSFRCGMGKVVYLDHKGGPINARVVPSPDAPYGYTGLRLDPDPAPRGPSAAETTAWAAGMLGAERPGEFRGYPWTGKWHHSGPVDVPGMLTMTFICQGPATVDVTVLQPRGDDLFSGTVPCGRPFPADVPVGREGVMVMVDSNNHPVQAAYSLVPVAGLAGAAYLVSPDESRVDKAAVGAVRMVAPRPDTAF